MFSAGPADFFSPPEISQYGAKSEPTAMSARITTILLAVVALASSDAHADETPYTTCTLGAPPTCWASSASWDANAQAITWDWIEDMEEAEIMEPSESLGGRTLCWASTFSDAHFCLMDIGGAMLWGRPISELTNSGSCGLGYLVGPWTSTFMSNGICMAVVTSSGASEAIAVALDV